MYRFFSISVVVESKNEKNKLSLWYDTPAMNWNEALSLGNGYVGAMVFGGVAEERISLNEGTLYSREPSVMFKDIKITSQRLEEVASMLRKGEYKQAYENIISKKWLGRLPQSYQPLGIY